MSAFWLWLVANLFVQGVCGFAQILDGHLVRNRLKIARKPLISHDLGRTQIVVLPRTSNLRKWWIFPDL